MTRVVQHSSTEGQTPRLSPAALEEAVRAADPAAILVPPRILRRVIKHHGAISGLGLRVPHRKSYVIAQHDLLAIVDRAQLDLPASVPLPDTLILLARPSGDALLELPAEEVLIKYWRLLFHARVHEALDRAVAEGRLNDGELRSRIGQIGETEFDEIRFVLRQEDYLLPPKDDRTVYVEFAAVYLELRYFVPSLLRSYFPALEDHYHVDEVLSRDVDGPALLTATRLAGTAMPDWKSERPTGELISYIDPMHDPQPVSRRLPVGKRSDKAAAALLAKADRVSALGNLVRAAILRTRAARLASPEVAHAAREEARGELERLARRLQAALRFTANEADEWTRSLASLIEQAARGIWTSEARMLYDLQKVCVDHERGIYMLDVWGWATSLGRKSLKRFLPGQRDVLVHKHLRSASRRLRSARVSHRGRSRLAALLTSAVRRAEANLRARFKPPIERALDKVKLLPQNPPERVARKKLVEEILDRVVVRGFLTMSDLRDALSRNNLKLPDLASVRQFLSGDQLLQADRLLAATLDGVYHRGEVYLRFPQRLSSLAFGTPLGRFLTRYAALPFGGAYIALEGLQHLVELLGPWFTGSKPHVHLASFPSVIALGVFLLMLIHNRRFRAQCAEGVVRVGVAFRSVFVDFPRQLLSLPLVRRIVDSPQFSLFIRFVFKPLVVSVFAGLLIGAVSDAEVTMIGAIAMFVVVNLLLNSPIGRNVDELVTDWFVHAWHRLRIHVLAALFRFIMDLFNRILETLERLLYTVDEWLRFRAGERRSATVVKAVLGFFWYFINYFIRFCVTLLIEPQVNPIKHFPVVTVSHKIMLPLIVPLQQTLAGPLGKAWATFFATPIVFLTPGVFGFLVWELKENWRLYAANRPPTLQPIVVGQHGETVLQFLRPGFRSGTLPKLYAKLRRANRKALYTDNWKACSKYVDGLHHVGEAMSRFADRELVALLRESRSWADSSISTGEVHLAGNRILIELYSSDLAEASLWLAFEEHGGWLVAAIHRRGWLDSLSNQRRHTLASALAGFYKMAGVTLVREQIESRLEPNSRGYSINDEALLVWTSDNRYQLAIRLSEWPAIQYGNGANSNAMSPLDDRAHWVFAATSITWRRWVVTWELDQLDGFSRHNVLENIALLPP